MGWVWRDDAGELDSPAGDNNSSPWSSGDRCSTRKVVKSQCKTEEVEPGKFVRKCERTEEILRDCIGRYLHVLFSDLCCPCPVAIYFNLTIVVFQFKNSVFCGWVKIRKLVHSVWFWEEEIIELRFPFLCWFVSIWNQMGVSQFLMVVPKFVFFFIVYGYTASQL